MLKEGLPERTTNVIIFVSKETSFLRFIKRSWKGSLESTSNMIPITFYSYSTFLPERMTNVILFVLKETSFICFVKQSWKGSPEKIPNNDPH